MKKVLLLTAFSAISFLGFSQEKSESKPLSFSGGLELALPMGDFAEGSSFGFGASLQMDYNIASKTDLTVNAGYISFSAKEGGGSQGVIPVLAGIKYDIADNIYASMQLGMMNLKGSDGAESVSAFAFAPGVGYKMNKMDFQLRYTSASKDGFTFNWIGLRAAYSF